jgi:hypothetical protein
MLADGGLVYGRGQRCGGWEEMWTRWQAVTTGGGHLLRAEGRGVGERTCGAGEKGRERGRRAESVMRARGKSASENGGLMVLIESTVSFV